VVPNRGLILDRNGEVLAANYSAYTLEITPSKVANVSARSTTSRPSSTSRRATGAASEASGGEQELRELADSHALDRRRSARFAVNRFRFPGFEIKARLFRSYPQAKSPRMRSATSGASTTRT